MFVIASKVSSGLVTSHLQRRENNITPSQGGSEGSDDDEDED